MDNSTITIGGQSKTLIDADTAWVTSQVAGRGGHDVCIVIKINTDEAKITLATAACSMGGGGGGTPQFRPHEQEIIDLWRRKNLNGTYSTGDVVSFFNELKRIL